VFAVRDVSSEEALSEYFFGFAITLIDIIFLENYLFLPSHIFVRMNDVVVSLVELVIAFVDFWG